MSKATEPANLHLSSLFGAALEEMAAHRHETNELDGDNGNHGRSSLDQDGVTSIVQPLLGGIPTQAETQSGDSVLEQVMGLAGGQGSTASGDSSVLSGLMGAGPTAEATQEAAAGNDLGMDDLLGALLPAGLAFLRARQSGKDGTAAAGQALIGVLLGGQANPLQAKTPRTAAGGLVAQSLPKALVGGAR